MNQDWAICVGIGSYLSERRLHALPGAPGDAEAFHTWLLDAEGGDVQPDQATLIRSPLEQSEEAPNPIAGGIESWFTRLHRTARRSEEAGRGFVVGRRLYVYYSGHGLSLGSVGETVLLCADADPPESLEHVAGKLYAEFLGAAGAFEQVVLIMDCCRNTFRAVPPREPPWKPRRQREPEYLYVYAAAEGTSAREVVIDGEPRGALTHTLLERLRQPPPAGGLRIRTLADHLYADVPRAAPGVPTPHVDYPTDPGRNFVFLEAPPGTVGDAGGPAWPDSGLESAAFRRSGPGRDPAGQLEVLAADDLATIDVWDARGRRVTQALGRARVNLPHGTYTARASIGKAMVEAEASLRGGYAQVQLPAIPLSLPAEGALAARADRSEGLLVVLGSEGTATMGDLEGTPVGARAWQFPLSTGGVGLEIRSEGEDHGIVLCPPMAPGWRTEVRADPELLTRGLGRGLAVRMVRAELPPGAATPTDRTRDLLRTLLSAGGVVTEAQIDAIGDRALGGDDPVLLMMIASLDDARDRWSRRCRDRARELLGQDVSDLALLDGATTVASPPVLEACWRRANRDGALEAEPDSLAATLAGRLVPLQPWLVWTSGEPTGFLRSLATAIWPSWEATDDDDDDGLAEVGTLAHAARGLALPAGSVRSAAYKSPPVALLVPFDEGLFVGATNDQLAPALAVAFAERGGRPWARLEVWFLDDDALARVTSAARTGASLRRARRRARAELERLLPRVATAWRTATYPGLRMDDQWTFASLFGGRREGAFAHASRYRAGEDVRTTASEEAAWIPGQPAPDLQQRLFAAVDATLPTLRDVLDRP